MSEEILAVVRRGLVAFNARDVEGFAELVTEDFVWAPALPGAVGGGPYVGGEGVGRYFSETAQTWTHLAVECDELRAVDTGVLMLGRAVGRGVGSGAAVEMPLAFVAEFRGERIAKVRAFRTHGEAIAAVGQ